MYYKIENKNCEVYKKLHALRSTELKMESENLKAIEKKIGFKFKNYFGSCGQQNFRRVSQFSGFEFKDHLLADPKIWKQHKDHVEIMIPNRRTALGREMSNFLKNGLKGSKYSIVFDILDVEHYGRFTFPFVDLCGDLILVFIDDSQEPKDKNLVEITKREFNQIRDIQPQTAEQ